MLLKIGSYLIPKNSIVKVVRMNRQLYGDVLRIELRKAPAAVNTKQKPIEYPDINYLEHTKTLDVDFNYDAKSESSKRMDEFLKKHNIL